jgi:putative oxidoreductase
VDVEARKLESARRLTAKETIMAAHSAAFGEHSSVPSKSRALNVSLWIVQGLLALAFALAGIMKTSTPIAELATRLPWTADVPAALVRFIGTAERLAAACLILPAATRVRPGLTALAAAGLALGMALALAFHAMRGELGHAAPLNLLLGGLAAFVAWGRFKKAPIRGRW